MTPTTGPDPATEAPKQVLSPLTPPEEPPKLRRGSSAGAYHVDSDVMEAVHQLATDQVSLPLASRALWALRVPDVISCPNRSSSPFITFAMLGHAMNT